MSQNFKLNILKCPIPYTYLVIYYTIISDVSANLHALKARCPFTRFVSGSTAFDGFQLNFLFWLYGSRSSSVYSVTRLQALPVNRGSVPDKDKFIFSH
jgi:hypothetical protein